MVVAILKFSNTLQKSLKINRTDIHFQLALDEQKCSNVQYNRDLKVRINLRVIHLSSLINLHGYKTIHHFPNEIILHLIIQK